MLVKGGPGIFWNYISDTINDVYNANIEDLHGLNVETNQ